MDYHNPHQTLLIRAGNLPEAATAGFQVSLQKLLVEHGLIVEKSPWELIRWKQLPTTDGYPSVEVLVSKMESLEKILNGLSNLALEPEFKQLVSSPFKLTIREQPALTVRTTLQSAWLIRQKGDCVVHSEKVVSESESPSRRPAACRNPALVRARVQRMLANQPA
jgi:hypothetical protein